MSDMHKMFQDSRAKEKLYWIGFWVSFLLVFVLLIGGFFFIADMYICLGMEAGAVVSFVLSLNLMNRAYDERDDRKVMLGTILRSNTKK